VNTDKLLIAFEGIDGCGKGTQIELLTNWLEDRGRRVKTVADPGATPASRAIRNILLDKQLPLSPEQQTLLYTAARICGRNTVAQHQAEGFDVIVDRWVMSTFVYQGMVQHVLQTIVQALHEEFVKRDPDLYIVLDLPANIAQHRLALANTKEGDFVPDADRFESLGVTHAENLRKGYRLMAEDSPNAWIVDAEQSPEDVFAEVLEACKLKLDGFAELAGPQCVADVLGLGRLSDDMGDAADGSS